jgi:hypothetical protein
MDVTATNSAADVKAWGRVVAGYSVAAVALVVFLTINGASGIPAVATIGTAGLAVIGLLLPIAGILQLRRGIASGKTVPRLGFVLQAFGLFSLMFGLVFVVAVSSLSSYLLSALFVMVAGVSAIAGAVLLRRHFICVNTSNKRAAVFLILGTALVFTGVGLIVASNIAFQYLISQLENTVYVDVGATVSACGCILAAYSFFTLYNPAKHLKNQ